MTGVQILIKILQYLKVNSNFDSFEQTGKVTHSSSHQNNSNEIFSEFDN
jgi:hypothetical protein